MLTVALHSSKVKVSVRIRRDVPRKGVGNMTYKIEAVFISRELGLIDFTRIWRDRDDNICQIDCHSYLYSERRESQLKRLVAGWSYTKFDDGDMYDWNN